MCHNSVRQAGNLWPIPLPECHRHLDTRSRRHIWVGSTINIGLKAPLQISEWRDQTRLVGNKLRTKRLHLTDYSSGFLERSFSQLWPSIRRGSLSCQPSILCVWLPPDQKTHIPQPAINYINFSSSSNIYEAIRQHTFPKLAILFKAPLLTAALSLTPSSSSFHPLSTTVRVSQKMKM